MHLSSQLAHFFLDFVFSTAHKAKGLEFSTVRLTDDFMAGNQQTMFVALANIGLVFEEFEEDMRMDMGKENIIAVRPGE